MRRLTAISVLVAGFFTLLALPVTSVGKSDNVVSNLLGGVQQTLTNVRTTLDRLRAQPGANHVQVAPRGASPSAPGGYNPPLHGQDPHGEGAVATIGGSASERPASNDPAGAQGELVVVGRSVAEQQPGGDYHSHITIASVPILNLEIGVDAKEGQSVHSPLDPVQQGLLNGLCNATAQSVCLSVLKADASASNTSSSANFEVANAQLGGPSGIGVSAASSNGSVSQDATCQTAAGGSNTANAGVLGLVTAGAIDPNSTAKACTDGSKSQTNTGKVLQLNGAGVPLPAPGCENGTANTTLDLVIAQLVCNANESNGAQGPKAFPTVAYGVREGLNAFLLTAIKGTVGSGESVAVASPAGPGNNPPGGNNGGGGNGGNGNGGNGGNGNGNGGSGNKGSSNAGNGGTQCSDGVDNDGDGLIDFPNDPGCSSAADDSEAGSGNGGAPQCSDGIDNDGDGKIDFPNDPQCSSALDDSEADQALAFTGTNLLLTLLMGALVLLLGLKLREVSGRLGREPRA